MLENYTDEATKYADEQIALNGNVEGNDNTNTSSTNPIPPTQVVNGKLYADSSTHGNIFINERNYNNHSFEGLFYTIFNKSNIVLIVWFLAIYFIAYFFLGFVFNKTEDVGNNQLRLSRTIDIIFLFFLIIIIISTYVSYSDKQKENLLQSTWDKSSIFFNDPLSIFSTALFIASFYIVVYLFRLPMDSINKPLVLSFIETGAWVIFVIILITDFFKYVLGISFTGLISKLFDWSSLPDDQINLISRGNVIVNGNNTTSGNTYVSNMSGNVSVSGNAQVSDNTNINGNTFTSQPVQQNEVFNISNNLYTYDDAQSICSSYGANMATYDQIEEAYNKGGEWCNYGWSDGQMAFFPTQKSTWQELQKDPKRKNNCGRPGVNGGYFANPYIKFGVNCYGKKPDPTASDLDRMQKQKEQDKIQPKTTSDSALDKKVQFWKDNADKLLVLNSYNKDHWSEN
jgi:hypothetical protein